MKFIKKVHCITIYLKITYLVVTIVVDILTVERISNNNDDDDVNDNNNNDDMYS